MSPANSIQAINLACRRGERLLFKQQNFELRSGQLLLVEGRNGSGKTTLLKTLATLRIADKGELLFNGQAVGELGSAYLQHISWLGHHNGIKEDLTAAENLHISRSLAPSNERKISEVLEVIGLKGYRHTAARYFSAGMKRRLALARLLLSNTPLWILDEPQSSLDRSGIALFEELATQHLRNGGMIVMTSHHDVGFDPDLMQRLSLG